MKLFRNRQPDCRKERLHPLTYFITIFLAELPQFAVKKSDLIAP